MTTTKLSLRARLTLILALPTLALAAFAAFIIGQSAISLTQTRTTAALAELVIAANHVIHEQQKERGMSAGFLASKGNRFQAELQAQRKLTNQTANALAQRIEQLAEKIRLPEEIQATLKKVVQQNKGMTQLREQIDAHKIAPPASAAQYSALIANAIDIISIIARDTASIAMAREATAYLMLTKAKEAAGQERAGINATLTSGTLDNAAIRRLSALAAAQTSHLQSFAEFASAKTRAHYQRALSGSAVDEAERIRGQIAAASSGAHFDITAEYWFKVSTARIDQMKSVEQGLDEDIQQLLNSEQHQAWTQLLIALLAALLATLVAVAISIWMIRNLLYQLGGEPEYACAITNAIAAGDLARHVELAHNHNPGSLLASIANMQQALRKMVTQMHDISNQVSDEARGLSANASELLQAAHEGSESAQSIAAAIEDMSTSVQNIAHRANEVNTIAAETGTLSASGNEIVRNTAHEMQSIAAIVSDSGTAVNNLGEQSERISTIVETIREIAEQTNLLALNAAIEAARAGEQGRGFAVVADEVRKLAERTSSATTEVADTIATIRDHMGHAEQSMSQGATRVEEALGESKRATDAMQQIEAAAQSSTQTISEISAALQEQSASSNQISQNVDRIATSSQQTSSSVAHIANSAKHLETLAEELERTMQRFRLPAARTPDQD